MKYAFTFEAESPWNDNVPHEFETFDHELESPSASMKPCPENSPGMVKDRCKHPGTRACPAIPNLLCVTDVGGIPFEYPISIKRNTGGLYEVRARKAVKQRFIPTVGLALGQFVANCAAFGMPIQAILTAGSLYCRCISNTDTLSNHSYGDAIDIVGIRWKSPAGARETIVHNYKNPSERALLRKINACLRLSFITVIDYHRSDHRDHFHCDMNRGGARNPKGKTTLVFVQEALNTLISAKLTEDGTWGPNTARALSTFSGRSASDLNNSGILNQVENDLFTRAARA